MREPLVLLPGMMCDARLFAPQLAAFSADSVVSVAPITQGETVEGIVDRLLDQLPAKFALAGLSMGGIVAMEMARRAPERITRLALMDTNPLAETPQSAAIYEPMIASVRAGRLGDVMRSFMKPEFLGPGPGRAAVLAQVIEMAEALGPDVFVRQVRALQRRRDQQSTLRRLKVPVLVMCGEHDGLTPVKRHKFMSELIPYARLNIIEGAGHLPTLEQPEATTAALRTWMTQPYVLK